MNLTSGTSRFRETAKFIFLSKSTDTTRKCRISKNEMDSSNATRTFFTKRWIAYGLILFTTAVYGIVVTGFVNTSFGTLERRFGFASTTIGIISGSSYFGNLVCSLPISLVAQEKGAPKLRLLSLGLVFIGLGSAFYSLPHYIASPVERPIGPIEENVCQSKHSETSTEPNTFPYEAFFIVGNFLHGVGSAPFYPVGYTYLSESTKIPFHIFNATEFILNL